jgi:hypothetical protein
LAWPSDSKDCPKRGLAAGILQFIGHSHGYPALYFAILYSISFSVVLHEKIIVDTTTNHFQKVVEFHQKLSAEGACYLEAPVL